MIIGKNSENVIKNKKLNKFHFLSAHRASGLHTNVRISKVIKQPCPSGP